MDNLTIAIAKGRIEKDIYRRWADGDVRCGAVKSGGDRGESGGVVGV